MLLTSFDFYMIEAKPENLIGDRAYDSDPPDAELRKDSIEMIAPHRGNRSKPPTQDRRRLSRYIDAGSSSASSPGFNGSAGSSFAGSTTPTISSALSSLPASLSSSNDFETGSSDSLSGWCKNRTRATPAWRLRLSPRARCPFRVMSAVSA